MIKVQTKKVIDCFDWDKLVQETYNKPYCFQQQEGCQSRGNVRIAIPDEDYYNEDLPENIPFKINGGEMGVKFQTWLNTSEEDINSKHPESYKGQNILFWHRNFYPSLQIIANDLHKKGLIETGDYTIEIDW